MLSYELLKIIAHQLFALVVEIISYSGEKTIWKFYQQQGCALIPLAFIVMFG